MSVKTDNIQMGLNATAANNFIFNPDGAGGMKLQRGTVVNGVATPISDILTIASDDTVTILKPEPWVVNTANVTPSSGAFFSVVSTLRTRKQGKIVFYHYSLDISNVGNAAGPLTVTLPYAAASVGGNREWNGAGRESNVAGYTIMCWVKNGTSQMLVQTSSAIATGHLLNVSGFYETAT